MVHTALDTPVTRNDLKTLIEAREREQTPDLPASAQDHEPTAGLPHLAIRLDDCYEPL